MLVPHAAVLVSHYAEVTVPHTGGSSRAVCQSCLNKTEKKRVRASRVKMHIEHKSDETLFSLPLRLRSPRHLHPNQLCLHPPQRSFLLCLCHLDSRCRPVDVVGSPPSPPRNHTRLSPFLTCPSVGCWPSWWWANRAPLLKR